MTEYISRLRNYFIAEQKHHQFRQPEIGCREMAKIWKEQGLSDLQRATKRLIWMLDQEQPVVLPEEKIALLRTVSVIPEIFTEEEFEAIQQEHYIHEQGKVCNVNPLYSQLIDVGFDRKKEQILVLIEEYQSGQNREAVEFLTCCIQLLEAIEEFAERYRKEAQRAGNQTVAEAFARIPRQPPKTFAQALQFFRLIHYCLWASFNYHNTVGRFDQYMFTYYDKDIKNGTLTKDSALELLEEFFISFNKDSDLYTGMQQGDNGQSMVLGGMDKNGNETYNDLSELCMQASLELKLIDPKINLRVHKKTPLSSYERGTHLTKQGLGFPQYANDDIVIEALKRWGYSDDDAYDYVVAACWEFIVPGAGMDLPNINGLSFPMVVSETIERLEEFNTFEECMEAVKENIFKESERLCASVHNLYMEPAPFLSLMMLDCTQKGKDISLGGRYNNFGLHGSGLSTAVDSLAMIRKYVYDDDAVSKEELLRMLKNNFSGYEEFCAKLRFSADKMGNDKDEVDEIAVRLLDWFADSLDGKQNERGGIFRPGTGSAMYYVWQSKHLMATPDGRKYGEEFACNYSPSLLARCNGPFSIMKSFTKPDLVRVCNGGPLTIELHDTLFRNDDSIRKVAMFVKTFFDLGGHQMQINAVNREKMLDAKKHPEKYRNLIVRVWGWSGYFVELDDVYQDQIIKRMELLI